MVIYVKLGETGEVKQFTTRLEVRDYLNSQDAEEKISVAVHKDPTDKPEFSVFDKLEGVTEFVDSQVDDLAEEDDSVEDAEEEDEEEGEG